MPPYDGAIVDQPDSLIKKWEVVMQIVNEDEQKAVSNNGPPPQE